MSKLTLKTGPRLILTEWVADKGKGTGKYVDRDITPDAVYHLFDRVALAPDVTLHDIFMLLTTHPAMLEVYRNCWAQELLDEVQSRPHQPRVAEYDPEGIEYLELYQVWEKDSVTGEIEIYRLSFHGIGFELNADLVRDGLLECRAGGRVHWGLSFTPLTKLLHFPIRFNPDVVVTESNVNSKHFTREIERASNHAVTLGQVIHGVLWELSFYGGPEDRAAESQKIQALYDEVKSGGVKAVAWDLFAEEKLALLKCFISADGIDVDALHDAMLEIDDAESAGDHFFNEFGLSVVLQPELAGMTGMEFRKYVDDKTVVGDEE